MSRYIKLCVAAAVACGAAAAHADTRVQFATGGQYSDGEYGEITNTQAFVVPFYARVSTGAWSFQVSVPYVRVSGPAALGELFDDNGGSNSGSGSSGSGSGGSDDDPTLPPTTPAEDREVSGIGDTSLTASYSMPKLAQSPVYMDLRARVRFPTGSRADGIGTGATDYALLTEIGVATNRGGVYLSGGRRFLGEVEDVERQDGWQAGAGVWWTATQRFSLGANVDWRDASAPGGEDPSSAEAWMAWRRDSGWRFEVNGGVGLSDSSADYTLGFTVSWRSAAL